MLFACYIKGTNLAEYFKVIESPTWFDARSYAARLLMVEIFECQLLTSEAPADYQLQWISTDSGARGGSKDGRRLQVRKRNKKTGNWFKWKDDRP